MSADGNANGIIAIQTGTYNTANATWEIPTASQTGDVSWELIDEDGNVYSQGVATSLSVSAHPWKIGTQVFQTETTVEVPFNVPVNTLGSQYRIKWVLTVDNTAHYLFDAFTVIPSVPDREGVVDQVEMPDTEVLLAAYINYATLDQCTVNVYNQNTLIYSADLQNTTPTQTTDGYLWSIGWSATSQVAPPSLFPLTVMFQYKASSSDVTAQSVTGQVFICNPSLLAAARELETVINAAYQDSGVQPFTPLDQPTLFNYLQQGMDRFNSVVRPTNFTMTNAQSGLRQYWLGYSTVAACRAQALAEGMRAFNFSGSSVTLDVDRVQYWEAMASAKDSELSEHIKPFKDMLAKWGIQGGDGSMIGPTPASSGAIGIRLTPLTPMRTGGVRTFPLFPGL